MHTKKKLKTATLYRTVMADHICPHGLKCKDLLQREGFSVNDQKLKSREEVDRLKSRHNVQTVPQVFIDEVRIGGFDDLRQYFGKTTKSADEVTYQPIIDLYCTSLLQQELPTCPHQCIFHFNDISRHNGVLNCSIEEQNQG